MKNKIAFLSLFSLLLIFESAVRNDAYSESQKNYGIILGDVVIVRQQPDRNSKIVETVKENEELIIIEWTNKKEKIGKFTDKWVKIKTKSGKTGFIFGAFVFDLNILHKPIWENMVDTRYPITGGSGDFYYFKREGEAIRENISNYLYRRIDSGKYVISGRKISLHFNKSESFHLDSRTGKLIKQDIRIEAINKKEIYYLFKAWEEHLLVNSLLNVSFNLPSFNGLRFNSTVNYRFLRRTNSIDTTIPIAQ